MSREITLLHPELQEIIPRFLEECKIQGLIVKTTDTLRTKNEQDNLYEQGRTKPGKVVTWVKYPYSNHNWGMAFDFCRNDGKGAYFDSDGWFKKVGQIGKKFGLEWGGDWEKQDKPHFELTKYGTTNELVKKYGTFEDFKKTWGHIEDYKPVNINNENYKSINNENYMLVKRSYKYEEKIENFNVINFKGENYIRVRDAASLMGKEVEYDNVTKVTTIF